MIGKGLPLLLAAVLLASQHAIAYEQATHALITKSALLQSDLLQFDDGELSPRIRSLGLDVYHPFGNAQSYFEFIGSLLGISAYERYIQPYERTMLDALRIDWASTPLQSWVMFGAIREDDNPSEDPPTPQDVETGIRRPLHHFFDPYFNRPLTVSGLDELDNDVQKNVDWALGVRDTFSDPNHPQLPRRNHFTIPDAREAMFRALTLKTSDGATYTDIAAGVDTATQQHWRQLYWTTALRALGDVLHLNQDMAQPQHTRNEAHSGKACTTVICLGGHTSIYEKYINSRALNRSSFNALAPFNATVAIQPEPLPLKGYSTPGLAKYSDYWSTSPGSSSLSGKGLADYSNRGFFSAANNLGSNPYKSPSNAWTDYQVGVASAFRWDGTVSSDSQPTFILFGSVDDRLTGQVDTHVPLTSKGMWDQFLEIKSLPLKYTLNRLHYDAMANLLLPRAVAYSAGLINFFFRGRIEIALPDEGVFALADHGVTKGFTKLRAKITNATASFVDAQNNPQPQRMNGGTFFAVIRYHTDKQYVDSLDTVVGTSPCDDFASVVNPAKLDASTQCRDGVEQIIVSKPFTGIALDAGGQALVEFDFQNSPIPYAMTDVILQIVYRGPLGSETDAVAVGTIDVSEPTYFTYHNATDYIHLGEHVYTRGEVDSNPQLLALVQPQYCVDYRQTPPHLVSGCLDQFKLDLAVSFGDLSKPIAQVEGLPNRRFVRVAWLTTADDGFNSPAKKAARGVSVMVRPHVDGDSARPSEKASLNQRGTCLPLDPFDIPARHSQMTVISPTQVGYRVDRLDKLRDVNGWFSTSCIVNGDDATPGTPDDRTIVMSPLVPMTDEVLPYPVNIMPAYLAAPGAIAAM